MEKRKKRKKPIISIKMLLFILFSIMILFVFINQSLARKELKNKKVELEKEIEILEGETKILRKELEESDSLEFIERVARDDYGMVKPGEVIYIDLNERTHIFGGTPSNLK